LTNKEEGFQIPKPIYFQIYKDIKKSIQQGTYKPGSKLPSEKEFAKKWNVSVITPRKALSMLRDEGLITRQAGRGSFVRENISSDAPLINKKPMIGVVFTDFDNSFGRGLLNGIEKGIEGKANFLFRRSFGSPKKEEQIIKDFLELGIDALIILPAHSTHLNHAILQLVIDEFPLVLIDRYLKDVAAAAVGTKNISAAKKGTKYLFDAGHDNILVLSTPPAYAVVVEERINGVLQAFQERDISTQQLLIYHDITSTIPNAINKESVTQDINHIKEHIKNNPDKTAIFAIEYNIALLARLAIKDLGLNCPDDISIICFDSPEYNIGDFSFTHLIQDQKSIGKLAVEKALKILSTSNEKQITLLDAQLVEGESIKKITTSNKL